MRHITSHYRYTTRASYKLFRLSGSCRSTSRCVRPVVFVATQTAGWPPYVAPRTSALGSDSTPRQSLIKGSDLARFKLISVVIPSHAQTNTFPPVPTPFSRFPAAAPFQGALPPPRFRSIERMASLMFVVDFAAGIYAGVPRTTPSGTLLQES